LVVQIGVVISTVGPKIEENKR